MQKKLIALAVAGLVSGGAFAQSNVQIYGIADAYYGYFQGGQSKATHTINSGGLSTSRIGFKGVEDISPNLKALFVLEYKLTNDTGASVQSAVGAADANGIGNARQQLVGLTGGWGTAVAGHAQTTGFDFACATSGFSGGAVDNYKNVSVGTLLSCSDTGRANNAVAYISPNWSGFSFAVNHARVTENTIQKDASGPGSSNSYANLISANYKWGSALNVNAVYSKVSVKDTVAMAVLPNSDLVEWGVNASYDFNVAKVYASYQISDLKEVDNKDKQWGVSASFPIADTGGAIHAGYSQSTFKETIADKAKLKSFTVAYTQSLSKRTTAYAAYSELKNANEETVAALPHTSVITITPTGYNWSSTSRVFAVGLRHAF